MQRHVSMNSKIAVVTGANRGIGFEICRQLAQQDVHVILTSRDGAKGRAARDRLAASGLAAVFHHLDVTDAASIHRLADWVAAEYGCLHILVNNAGLYIDDRHSLLTVDMDVMRRTMATNAYGPLMVCQALVPLMKRAGYGRVVNVSSGIGELGSLGPSYPAYRTSKIVLNIHTRILAGELRDTGILVNAVCPGWVRTDMGGPGAPVSVAEGADTAVWLATLPDDGPTGKFFRNQREISW
jgi:NAD(P)-dependent dehydrogenase (short-subunit alcohol dehydrogenase family)